MICREFKHIQAGIRMQIVETWYFQIWVNFGGMADCLYTGKSKISMESVTFYLMKSVHNIYNI